MGANTVEPHSLCIVLSNCETLLFWPCPTYSQTKMQANFAASWTTMLLAVLFIFLAMCAASESGAAKVPFRIPKQWTHANVLRTIDLSSPVVRETVSLVAQNTGSSQASVYYFTL